MRQKVTYTQEPPTTPTVTAPKSVIRCYLLETNQIYSIRFVCNWTWNACWTKFKLKRTVWASTEIRSARKRKEWEKIPEKEWKIKRRIKVEIEQCGLCAKRKSIKKEKCEINAKSTYFANGIGIYFQKKKREFSVMFRANERFVHLDISHVRCFCSRSLLVCQNHKAFTGKTHPSTHTHTLTKHTWMKLKASCYYVFWKSFFFFCS